MNKFILIGAFILLISGVYSEGQSLNNPIVIETGKDYDGYLQTLANKYFSTILKQGEVLELSMETTKASGSKYLEYLFLDKNGIEIAKSKCSNKCTGIFVNNQDEKEIYLRIRSPINPSGYSNLIFSKKDFSDYSGKEAPTIEYPLELEDKVSAYNKGLKTEASDDYLFVSIDESDSYSMQKKVLGFSFKSGENCSYIINTYRNNEKIDEKEIGKNSLEDLEYTNNKTQNYIIEIKGNCEKYDSEQYVLELKNEITEKEKTEEQENTESQNTNTVDEMPAPNLPEPQANPFQVQKLEEMRKKNEIKQDFLYLLLALVGITVLLMAYGYIKK